MKLCRALAGTDEVDVNADTAQPGVLAKATRKSEGFATRLVLAFAGRRILGACQPVRAPVAALA